MRTVAIMDQNDSSGSTTGAACGPPDGVVGRLQGPADCAEPGALTGLRVLDCTNRLANYATRLLAGLGADVVRVTSVDGSADTSPALDDLYLNGGKRTFEVDPSKDSDRAWLVAAACSADVIFETHPGSLLSAAGIEPELLRERNPSLVHTCVSPFGRTGPDGGRAASDLTLMARGGLMWLAGEPDLPPVRPAGHQSEMAAGLYAAIGSLIGVLSTDSTGEGQRVDVAALECVASALENATQYWDLEHTIRRRTGSRPREAGSGLFRCEDGHVYMMAGRLSTPRGWIAIVEWLNEVGAAGAAELQKSHWSTFEYRTRPDAARFFEDVFTEFARNRKKAELYEDGQKRGIVICPLNTPIDLLSDRQLRHRGFFVPLITPLLDKQVLVPRAPFVLSHTPFRVLRPPEPCDLVAGRPCWREAKPRRHSRKLPDRHSKLPLAGIRVADFTWVGAGPFATKILADHGAEVIKIESATRPDALRGIPPFAGKVKGINRSGYFANRNTSKKSLTLNLRDPRGVEIARRLIAKSDIVANSFTPGTMESWGLGYEQCMALRPDVIYLSMPMHGGDGPHGSFLGYGAAISALSGLYASTGYPDRDPVGTGTNYPDHVPNPCHAVVAMLAALRYREHSGLGQSIELSQVESSICILGPLVLAAQVDYKESNTNSAVLHGNREPGVAPHGVYPSAGSDRWIALACWSESDWDALCRAAAGSDWLGDPRFSTLAGRIEHQDELDGGLASWTRGFDCFELAERLRRFGVDAAPVQNSQDVLERDLQLRHLQHWVRLNHSDMGNTVYDAPPFHLSQTPGSLRSPAPLLGQHTVEICTDLLGLDQYEVQLLAEAGVLK